MIDSKGPTILVSLWVMTGTTLLFIVLRLYCKDSYTRKLRADDAILIFAWVSCPSRLSTASIVHLLTRSVSHPCLFRSSNCIGTAWNGEAQGRYSSKWHADHVQVSVLGWILYNYLDTNIQDLVRLDITSTGDENMAPSLHLVRDHYDECGHVALCYPNIGSMPANRQELEQRWGL